MNKDIKIIFMGTPLFGVNVLEKLNEEYSVMLVVTQPDKRGKRGSSLVSSPVKEYALNHNLKLFQPESIKLDNQEILDTECDFIVTAAYGQFIPKVVLNHPKYNILNVHGSALPKYRGGAPIQRAIMNGDEYLGVTIMNTVSKMDSGSIYHTSIVKLSDDDTTSSMMDKLSKVGREDLIKVINAIYNMEGITSTPQDESLATYSPNISKEEEYIDFNEDALYIHNKVRALYDDPIAKLNHNDNIYKIYKTKVVKTDSSHLPGTILDNNKELIIKCGKDAISILEIQSPGKNVLKIADFLNGKRKEFS